MAAEQSTITGAGMVAQNAGNVSQGDGALNTDNPALDNEQDKMFDFSTARIHLQRMVEDWQVEIEDTDVRRKTRDVDIDVEGLRQKNEIDEDETIIPVRVIDVNITREQPPYINYLKNSRRICTFRSLSNPNQDSQNIEQAFTQGMTYTGWETPHFKCLDGAQTHGWAAIEVVYDPSKPLNVGLEYVAHDRLFWPRSVESIKDAPRVVRMYKVTTTRMREWVRTFGFNGEQVDIIAAKKKETQKEGETSDIYKLFFKKEGIVYVAWFCLTDGVQDWLKAPDKLFLGISHKQQPQNITQMPGMPQQPQQPQWVPSDVKEYPVFVLPYRESEKPKVVDHKGRVFYDENKQEAQTAVLSAFVNGLTRASNVYSSPAEEDGTGVKLKELEDVKLTGGRIMSKPMTFWSPPYPDPMILNYLRYSDDANSEETNQVNFAALNREDSRKTAKEIGAAQQQQSLLNSVQLTLFSTFIREIYSFCWLIVQSDALQGLIVFLQHQVPDQQAMQQMQKGIMDEHQDTLNKLMMMHGTNLHPQVQLQMQNTVMQQLQQLQQNPPLKWENNFDVIGQVYELRAAGDVDVIQRQEKIQQMKQDWPVISQTPLAMRFLSDLIKLEYPDVGEQYAMILGQTDMLMQAKQEAAGLATIIVGILKQHPEIMKTISPQENQQLQQLIAQAMAGAGKTPQEVEQKIGGGKPKGNIQNDTTNASAVGQSQ